MAPSEETSLQQQTSGGDASAASENVAADGGTTSRDVWTEAVIATIPKENIPGAKVERDETVGEEVAALMNDLCEKVVALESTEEDDVTEDVREKCRQLLQELVSQAEKTPTTTVHRTSDQTVCCKLPLTKVSIALQLYLGRNLTLADSQDSKPAGPLTVPHCPQTPQADEQAPAVPTSYPSSLALPRRFLFQVEQVHQMVLSDGQKLFACDICSGVYQRSFSLKRHYLRTHINHRYLTERDMSNCGIVPSDRLAKEAKRNTESVSVQCEESSPSTGKKEESTEKSENGLFPGLYRCHMCSAFLDSKDDLKHHLSNHKPVPINVPVPRSKSLPSGSDSGEDTQLLCLYCDKTFSTVTMRKRHMSRSHPNAVTPETKLQHHKCAYCTSSPVQVFRELPHLVQHLVATHSDQYHACACCKIKFDSRTMLETHVKAYHPDLLHFCMLCAIQFESRAVLEKHVQVSHADMNHICSHCEFHCDSQVTLDQHMKASHPEQAMLKAHPSFNNHCIPCDQRFDSRTLFDLHMKTKHLESGTQNVLQFDSRAVLDKQLQAVYPPVYHTCAHCGLYFDNKSAHKEHLSSTHPDLYHPCTHCEMHFNSKTLLDQHLRAIHPNEQHACKWCSQCFGNKSILNEHIETAHYVCTHCQCDFETKILLHEHINKNHSTSSTHLIGEKSSHTQFFSNSGTKAGEFQYSCSICHQVFNDYVAMCRHHRIDHKGKRTLNILPRNISTDRKNQNSEQNHDKPNLPNSLASTPPLASQKSVTSDILVEESSLVKMQTMNTNNNKEVSHESVISSCYKTNSVSECVNKAISVNESDSQKLMKESEPIIEAVTNSNSEKIVNISAMNEGDTESKCESSDFTVQLPLTRISTTVDFKGRVVHSQSAHSENTKCGSTLDISQSKGNGEQNSTCDIANSGSVSETNYLPGNSLHHKSKHSGVLKSVSVSGVSENECCIGTCEQFKNSSNESAPKSGSENVKDQKEGSIDVLVFNCENTALNMSTKKQVSAEHSSKSLELLSPSTDESSKIHVPISSVCEVQNLEPATSSDSSEQTGSTSTVEGSVSDTSAKSSESEKVKNSLGMSSEINGAEAVSQSEESDSNTTNNSTDLENKTDISKNVTECNLPSLTDKNIVSVGGDRCLEQSNTASISCMIKELPTNDIPSTDREASLVCKSEAKLLHTSVPGTALNTDSSIMEALSSSASIDNSKVNVNNYKTVPEIGNCPERVCSKSLSETSSRFTSSDCENVLQVSTDILKEVSQASVEKHSNESKAVCNIKLRESSITSHECKVDDNKNSGSDASKTIDKRHEFSKINENRETLCQESVKTSCNATNKHPLRKRSRKNSLQMKYDPVKTTAQLRRSNSLPLEMGNVNEGCDLVKENIPVFTNPVSNDIVIDEKLSTKRILRSRSASSLSDRDVIPGANKIEEENKIVENETLISKIPENNNVQSLAVAELNNQTFVEAEQNVEENDTVMQIINEVCNQIYNTQKSNVPKKSRENVKKARKVTKKNVPEKKPLETSKQQTKKAAGKNKSSLSSAKKEKICNKRSDPVRKRNTFSSTEKRQAPNESEILSLKERNRSNSSNKNQKSEEIVTGADENKGYHDVFVNSKEPKEKSLVENVDDSLKREDRAVSNCAANEKEKAISEKMSNKLTGLTNKSVTIEKDSLGGQKEENLKMPATAETFRVGISSNDVKEEQKRTETKTVRGTRLRKFSRQVQSPEESHLDPETLFYCRIEGNIRENLLHHLDGKLGVSPTITTTASDVHTEDSHNHTHHHRSPGFTKRENGQCNLAAYIKGISHLDISTQLTMHKNLKRLNSDAVSEKVQLAVDNAHDVVSFSQRLCLNARNAVENKPGTVRRRSLRNRGKEAVSASSAASSFTASMALRQWSSCDDVNSCSSVELSGEWVRPRNYICAACGTTFTDLWDLEDHKYAQHPNVWCTHYEFEQSASGKRSQQEDLDLGRHLLQVHADVKNVSVRSISDIHCTKCDRVFGVLSDLHRHILECGGDTTWMLLPSPGAGSRRSRKWRPFGSRRRRQQGSHRRGMKRNIPTTPIKILGDSIQRMLANLPPKRATRRAIQFSEDEIKTRSQGTINSNHLLRKRFKVSSTLPSSQIVHRRVTQIANSALPGTKHRAKSAIPTQSKAALKRVTRGGRSLSPTSSSRTESPTSESRTSPASVHRSRSRFRRPLQIVDRQRGRGLKDEKMQQNPEVQNVPVKKINKDNEKEEMTNGATETEQISELVVENVGLNDKLKENENNIKQNDVQIVQEPGGETAQETTQQHDKVKSKTVRKRKVTTEKGIRNKKLDPLAKTARKPKVTKQKQQSTVQKKQDSKPGNEVSEATLNSSEKEEFDVDISSLGETYNILAAMRIAMLEGMVVSPKAGKQKNRRKSEPTAAVNSEIDDKMPELQKVEPLEPVGEVLSDIPILSPVAVDEKESKSEKLKSRRASLPGTLNVQDKDINGTKMSQGQNKLKKTVPVNSRKSEVSIQLQMKSIISSSSETEPEYNSDKITSKASINDCMPLSASTPEPVVLKLKVKPETSKSKDNTVTVNVEELKLSSVTENPGNEESSVPISTDEVKNSLQQTQKPAAVKRQKRPRRRNSSTPTWDRSPTKRNKRINTQKRNTLKKQLEHIDEQNTEKSKIDGFMDAKYSTLLESKTPPLSDVIVNNNSSFVELPMLDKDLKKKFIRNDNKSLLEINSKFQGDQHNNSEEPQILASTNDLDKGISAAMFNNSASDFNNTGDNVTQANNPSAALVDHTIPARIMLFKENNENEVANQNGGGIEKDSTNHLNESEAVSIQCSKNNKVRSLSSKNNKNQAKRKVFSVIKSKAIKTMKDTCNTVEPLEPSKYNEKQVEIHSEQNTLTKASPSDLVEATSAKTKRRKNTPKSRILTDELTTLLAEGTTAEVPDAFSTEISKVKKKRKSQTPKNTLHLNEESLILQETSVSKRKLSNARKLEPILDSLAVMENLVMEVQNNLENRGFILPSKSMVKKNSKERKKPNKPFNVKKGELAVESINNEIALLPTNKDTHLNHTSVQEGVFTEEAKIHFDDINNQILTPENSLKMINTNNEEMADVPMLEKNSPIMNNPNELQAANLIMMDKEKMEGGDDMLPQPNAINKDNGSNVENFRSIVVKQNRKKISEGEKVKQPRKRNKRKTEIKMGKQLLNGSKSFYDMSADESKGNAIKPKKIGETVQEPNSINFYDISRVSVENETLLDSTKVVFNERKIKMKIQKEKVTENKVKAVILMPDDNNKRSSSCPVFEKYEPDKDVAETNKHRKKRKEVREKSTEILSPGDEDSNDDLPISKLKEVIQLQQVVSTDKCPSQIELRENDYRETQQYLKDTVINEGKCELDSHSKVEDEVQLQLKEQKKSEHSIDKSIAFLEDSHSKAEDEVQLQLKEQKKSEHSIDKSIDFLEQICQLQDTINFGTAGIENVTEKTELVKDDVLEENTNNNGCNLKPGKTTASERNYVDLTESVMLEANVADSYIISSICFDSKRVETKDKEIEKAEFQQISEYNHNESESQSIEPLNSGLLAHENIVEGTSTAGESSNVNNNAEESTMCTEKSAASEVTEEVLPRRQARRTRCNTSYEEVYTWSDVTSETEDSSQDLPPIQNFPRGHEQLLEYPPSPPYLPIDAIKNRKKRKLHNNSRQYRNGRLVRKRKKRQKKLPNKRKPLRVNEFIVTDIETGQEESQDSVCSSTFRSITNLPFASAEGNAAINEDQGLSLAVHTEQLAGSHKKNVKTLNKKKKTSELLSNGALKTSLKRKRKRNVAVREVSCEELQSKPNLENTQKLNEDHAEEVSGLLSLDTSETANGSIKQKSKVKRKRSTASSFFCDLCKKHYSTNYNLMKHKRSRVHLKKGGVEENVDFPSSKEEKVLSSDNGEPLTVKRQRLENSPAENLELHLEESLQSESLTLDSNAKLSHSLSMKERENVVAEELLNGAEDLPLQNDTRNRTGATFMEQKILADESFNDKTSAYENSNLLDTQILGSTVSDGNNPTLNYIPCSATLVPGRDQNSECGLNNKQLGSESLTQESSASQLSNSVPQDLLNLDVGTLKDTGYTKILGTELNVSDKKILAQATDSLCNTIQEGSNEIQPLLELPNNEEFDSMQEGICEKSSSGVILNTNISVSQDQIGSTILTSVNAPCGVEESETIILQSDKSSSNGLVLDLQGLERSTLENESCENETQQNISEQPLLQQPPNWTEEQGAPWSYGGSWPLQSWSAQDAEGQWTADANQDGTVPFFPATTSSLGSILDSVNQILDNEERVEELDYQPYMMDLLPYARSGDEGEGLRELQQAMGATDEEMAMLQQLGESNCWNLEEADIMDLDSQKTSTDADKEASSEPSKKETQKKLPEEEQQQSTKESSAVSTEEQPKASSQELSSAPPPLQISLPPQRPTSPSLITKRVLTEAIARQCSAEKRSPVILSTRRSSSEMIQQMERVITGRGGLRNQDMLLSPYENKDMVCPVCSRWYVGLSALRAHLSVAHNSSTRSHSQAVVKRCRFVTNPDGGETAVSRHVCQVCKELLPDEQGLAKHVAVAHIERGHLSRVVQDQRLEGLSTNTSVGDQGLRTHMSTALGGLLTRALNKVLGNAARNVQLPLASPGTSPSPGSPMAQPTVPSCSNEQQQQQFACTKCTERFASEALRDLHISANHAVIRRSSADSLSSQDEGKEKPNSVNVTLERTKQCDEEGEEETKVSASPSAKALPVTPAVPAAPITQPPPQQTPPPQPPPTPPPPPLPPVPSSQIDKNTVVKREQESSNPQSEDVATIRAKAVAALKELSTRDRRGGIATGNSARKKSKEDRFRFPLVRKFPPSTNRFASLAEKKKKISPSKGKTGDETTSQMKGIDVYDFEDEVEKVEPMTKRIVTSSSIVTPIINKPIVQRKECSELEDEPKKKRRWNRIIVDSGDDTSDAETIVSILDSDAKRKCMLPSEEAKKVVASAAIDTTSTATMARSLPGKGAQHKRHRTAGIVVEERKSRMRIPSARRPKRSTKTDLLMSVFAKSRSKLVGRPQLDRDDSSDSSRNMSPARTNSDDEKPRLKC